MQGYDFFVKMQYLSMSVLFAIGGATGWAVYQEHNVRAWQWPTNLLRLCVFLYLEVCYVGVLNVFLLPLDCQWFSNSEVLKNTVRDFAGVGE